MSRSVLLICSLLVLAAGAAVADPIPNSTFATKSAGWFDGKDLTCPQICERQRAVAEGEKNTTRPAPVSYVCKVRKAEAGQYEWLFGTQFATRPACYTTGRNLKGEYSNIFYCLCVEPTRATLRKRPGGG